LNKMIGNDKWINQKELSKDQIEFAGARFVEQTSSVPEKGTLSQAMSSNNPLLRLPVLFKRFAFSTSRNLLDVARTNPEKLPRYALAYVAAGEAVGDIKAALSGLISGAVSEDESIGEAVSRKIKDRGEGIGTGNFMVDRIIANSLQSFLFGILGDAAEATIKGNATKSAFGLIAGPIGGDTVEGLSAVGKALATPFTEKPASDDLKPLGKFVVKKVPFIGSGLSAGLFDEKKKKGGSPFGNMGKVTPPKF
jgi:hypothetical protein